MKLEKEIKKEMVRLGLKSEKELLNILKNMRKDDLLFFFNNSKVGLLVVGNKEIFEENPLQFLEVSKKLQKRLNEKGAGILAYTVNKKLFGEIKRKLDSFMRR